MHDLQWLFPSRGFWRFYCRVLKRGFWQIVGAPASLESLLAVVAFLLHLFGAPIAADGVSAAAINYKWLIITVGLIGIVWAISIAAYRQSEIDTAVAVASEIAAIEDATPSRLKSFHKAAEELIQWGEQIASRKFYGRPSMVIQWFVAVKRFHQQACLNGEVAGRQFLMHNLSTSYRLMMEGHKNRPMQESSDEDLAVLRQGLDAISALRSNIEQSEISPSFTGTTQGVNNKKIVKTAAGDVIARVFETADIALRNNGVLYGAVQESRDALAAILDDKVFAEISPVFDKPLTHDSVAELVSWICELRNRLGRLHIVRDDYFPVPD